LEDGKKADYTLTPEGEAGVRQSALKAKASGLFDKDTLIVSSPFSRCHRTAEIAREVLGVEREIIFDDRLRERWFGDWEKTANANYQKVWADDRQDPGHRNANVESAEEVQRRTVALINDLEAKYEGRTVLLVSHGDALQIMQTGLKGESAALHRDIPHLETSEIRKLETSL
jgi:probable phosphoglycerate mutase